MINSDTALLALIVLAAVFAVYLLPIFIAKTRKTQHQDFIIAINIMLGWTVLGWLLAGIWAITEKPINTGEPT